MVDEDEAKDILYDLSCKIASGLNLTAKKDYVLPMDIKVHPFTLEPYVADINKDYSYQTNICIGKSISDEDVLPSICMDVQEKILDESIVDFFNNIAINSSRFKQKHPQIRRGILFFGAKQLSKDIIYSQCGFKGYLPDFLEALGPVWGHEDKIHSVLENIIKEQIAASENITRVLFSKSEFHSFRGPTIS